VALAVLAVLAVLAGCTGGQGAVERRGGAAGGDQAAARAVTDRTTARGGEPVLGAKWDWGRADRFAPYLRRVPGGGATFYELVWCDVEPEPGRLDWSRADQVVRSTSQLGYSLYLKLRVGSCWATGGQAGDRRGGKGKTASAMPADPTAYQAWVRAAVQRYAPMGVREYAIENEVNGQGFWASSPADYQRLATLGAAAVREADPRALVVDAGISSTAYGVAIADELLRRGRAAEAVAAYQRYYQRRFDRRAHDFPEVGDPGELRVALQGQQAQRNLAFMAVANQLAERKVVDVRQLHFYEPWDNLPAVLAYLRGVLRPASPCRPGKSACSGLTTPPATGPGRASWSRRSACCWPAGCGRWSGCRWRSTPPAGTPTSRATACWTLAAAYARPARRSCGWQPWRRAPPHGRGSPAARSPASVFTTGARPAWWSGASAAPSSSWLRGPAATPSSSAAPASPGAPGASRSAPSPCW